MKTKVGNHEESTKRYTLLKYGFIASCLTVAVLASQVIQNWVASTHNAQMSREANQLILRAVIAEERKLNFEIASIKTVFAEKIKAAVKNYCDACEKFFKLPEYCFNDEREKGGKELDSACNELEILCYSWNTIELVAAQNENRLPIYFLPEMPGVIAKDAFLHEIKVSAGKVSVVCRFLGVRDPFHARERVRFKSWHSERRAKDPQGRLWANEDDVVSSLFPTNEVFQVRIYPYNNAEKVVPASIGNNEVVVGKNISLKNWKIATDALIALGLR